MKSIQGNIVSLAVANEFDIIVHGCNCFCTMGSGVAESLKWIFPGIHRIDCETKTGDKDKLGTYSIYHSHVGTIILNAYTQWSFGTDKRHVDYNAISDVFKLIKQNFSGKTIAYPKIGAGLGGGDWDIISNIIDKELEGENHTLILL